MMVVMVGDFGNGTGGICLTNRDVPLPYRCQHSDSIQPATSITLAFLFEGRLGSSVRATATWRWDRSGEPADVRRRIFRGHSATGAPAPHVGGYLVTRRAVSPEASHAF